jgi:NAD(P)-dependent dehydrogenase (short-subunit alcohol dehydrogenase family)
VPVALITGAAQGLGHATALRLASDGFTVAVNDLADDGRLKDLAERTGGLAAPADISDSVAGPRVDADDAGITLDEMRQRYRELIPVRQLASAEDIAAAVAFLAGPGAGAVVG